MTQSLSKLAAAYKEFRQFFKYCLVGVSGTAIDLGALYLLVEYAGLPVIPAAILSFLLAVTNNFIFNKTWTFKNKSKNYRKLYIKFLIVATVGLGLTVSFMHLFVNVFEIWYMLAKLMTSAIVLTWNFLGNKLWTFRLRLAELLHPEKHDFELSIIVPAYNEECRIGKTLEAISKYIADKKLSAEIIVIDDGSKDDTAKIVQKHAQKTPHMSLVAYEKNRGKGYAVRRGVEASKGKYILFTDADNSTPIEEYENLRRALDKEHAQIAIGSRYVAGSMVKIKQPKYRIFISRFGNSVIRAFLIDGIKDTQCGFKLFNGKAAREIFSLQKVSRFGFDMEALVIARNLDYKIIEVPVSWYNSADSRVRPLKDGLITLKDLIFIKLNLWSGRYSDQ